MKNFSIVLSVVFATLSLSAMESSVPKVTVGAGFASRPRSVQKAEFAWVCYMNSGFKKGETHPDTLKLQELFLQADAAIPAADLAPLVPGQQMRLVDAFGRGHFTSRS